MDDIDWWIQDLINILFKRFIITNITSIIVIAILGIVLLYFIVTSFRFYHSMQNTITKDELKAIKMINHDITIEEETATLYINSIYDHREVMHVMQEQIDNLNKVASQNAIANITLLMTQQRERVAAIDLLEKSVNEKEKVIKGLWDKKDAILNKSVDNAKLVNKQLKKITRLNLITKACGVVLFVGTAAEYYFFGSFSLSYTKVAGIVFMIIYGLGFNLRELLKNLKKVIVSGEKQLVPKTPHPGSDQKLSIPLPPVPGLPSVKPLPSAPALLKATPISNTYHETIKQKKERRWHDRHDSSTSSLPVDAVNAASIQRDVPSLTISEPHQHSIDEKTYLDIVSVTRKIFSNLKMNGKRFIFLGLMHVVVAMYFSFEEYWRLIDVAIVFVIAQFASLWLFKSYVKIGMFSTMFNNAFSYFLYNEYMKSYEYRGTVSSANDKFKISRYILQYIDFQLGNELKVKVTNPEEVLSAITKQVVEKSAFMTFVAGITDSKYHDALYLIRRFNVHPSRSRYSFASIAKLSAAALSLLYGIVQIIRLILFQQ